MTAPRSFRELRELTFKCCYKLRSFMGQGIGADGFNDGCVQLLNALVGLEGDYLPRHREEVDAFLPGASELRGQTAIPFKPFAALVDGVAIRVYPVGQLARCQFSGCFKGFHDLRVHSSRLGA